MNWIKNGAMAGTIAAAVLAVNSGVSASLPNASSAAIPMVVTVSPSSGSNQLPTLDPRDVMVSHRNISIPVTRLERLSGESADMQLFVLLDDSTRSTSLGIQLPELKKFIQSLPDTTQVAIGYMRNGTFSLAQAFTVDRQKAAGALRLPTAMPGENGSPYFALSDLVKHWPSKQSTDRRVVLMLTDGVDRYYDSTVADDPYVDAASRDALKEGVIVYSIYLRGAGLYGRGAWVTNLAQSHLMEIGEETGGYAYFLAFSDPVTISPFLNNLQNRFDNQYQVTIEGLSEKGVQPVKFRTELPGLKIQGPTRVYVH